MTGAAPSPASPLAEERPQEGVPAETPTVLLTLNSCTRSAASPAPAMKAGGSWGARAGAQLQCGAARASGLASADLWPPHS
jgi:hypothetical protein